MNRDTALTPPQRVIYALKPVIVGQQSLLDTLMIGLLIGGHVLVEGLPGLAKTLTLKAFAKALGLSFARIQMTPDLLPADITGTRLFLPANNQFTVEKGPVFANLILVDEINRAPAKVQSALLEAMAEGQVSIGKETFPLPRPCLVMATQNPVEHEGVYRLPEAQLDRFALYCPVYPPNAAEELAIVQQSLSGQTQTDLLSDIRPQMTLAELQTLQKQVATVPVGTDLLQAVVDRIQATRHRPQLLALGASPRASMAWVRAAQALALLRGQSQVTAQELETVWPNVVTHRLQLSYSALADGETVANVVNQLALDWPLPQPFQVR